MASSLSSRSERVREREQHSANPLGGVRSKYPGPRHEISRDQSLSWWRRVLPVIQSHRVTFITAIVLSFVSLIFQVLVPNMLSNDIDHTFVRHITSLHSDVISILIVGLLAGASGIISRQFLYYTAYNVEADLRSLIYEHLTTLSADVNNVLKQNAGEVERTLLGVSAEVARNFIGRADEISASLTERATDMTRILDEKGRRQDWHCDYWFGRTVSALLDHARQGHYNSQGNRDHRLH